MGKREKLWEDFLKLEAKLSSLKGIVQNEMKWITKEEKGEVIEEFKGNIRDFKEELNELEQEVVTYVEGCGAKLGEKGLSVIKMSFLQPYIEKGYNYFRNVSGKGLIIGEDFTVDCKEEDIMRLVDIVYKEEGEKIVGNSSKLITSKYHIHVSNVEALKKAKKEGKLVVTIYILGDEEQEG